MAHPVFCNLFQDHPGADRSGRCRLERKASRHSPGASVGPAAPQRGAPQRGGPESASREGSQGRRSVEKEENLRRTAWESAISITLFCRPERRAEVRFGSLKQEGNDCVKKGQYQDALGKYTECLRLKPNECAIYTNRLEAPPHHGSLLKLLVLDPFLWAVELKQSD